MVDVEKWARKLTEWNLPPAESDVNVLRSLVAEVLREEARNQGYENCGCARRLRALASRYEQTSKE